MSHVVLQVASAAWLTASQGPGAAQAPAVVAQSPNGRNEIALTLRDGVLHWAVARDGRVVIVPSRLGFALRGAPALGDSLVITGEGRAERDTTFALVLGEVARVRDHHRERRVTVAERGGLKRTFDVLIRAYDDGVALRYLLPEQPTLGAFEITDELTEFAMADDMKAWWIPADVSSPDRQEMLFSSGPVSKVRLVHTPLTLVGSSGVHAVLHEADLDDYAGMYLQGRSESRTLRASLARWKDGTAVKGRTPFRTPWRTVQLADDAAGLVPSVLSLKLNPPQRLADASWLRAMKYNGIWWAMHVNTATWSTGPQHGATTANTKRYLDHAAANGLQGTLVEGWNRGWDGNWMQTGGSFDFLNATADFDLEAVAAYAKAKGVQFIAHNETATWVENYERQLDSAFARYARLGIRAVKTGYVGDTVNPLGHAHQSQFMVRHHRRVIETAARYGIGIVMHEPIKDTGERRTWPNMMSREGARGQEFNAWGGEGGNPPEHESILFFTRMLAGPMDYTPGIFNLRITRSGTNVARTPTDARPRSTLAKQLALYVVLYSPVQMAADLPENYEGQPAFQFIRDVAADWDTTVVVAGEIGDYVAVARKAKGKDEWFLGAVSDERARRLDLRLDFLPKGRRYVAEVYADAPGADWATNPEAVRLSQQPVTAATTFTARLARGGGLAVRIRPAR